MFYMYTCQRLKIVSPSQITQGSCVSFSRGSCILSLLALQIYPRMCLSFKPVRILSKIALYLETNLGRIDMFIILRLSIYKIK